MTMMTRRIPHEWSSGISANPAVSPQRTGHRRFSGSALGRVLLLLIVVTFAAGPLPGCQREQEDKEQPEKIADTLVPRRSAEVAATTARAGVTSESPKRNLLDEVEKGELSGREIELSEEATRRMGVRVAPVEMGAVRGGIDVPTEIELVADRVAHVTSIVSGQLVRVRVSRGDTVKTGQTLAVLRSGELGEARSRMLKAQARLAVAQSRSERLEQLRKEKITSERDFLEARGELTQARAERDAAAERLKLFDAAGSAGSDLQLTAPIAGIVIERRAILGQMVNTEESLFVLADLSRVWALGRIAEQDIGALKTGMEASVVLVAYPERVWRGKIVNLANRLDESTRTLEARVELRNADGVLRPGLFGTMRILAVKGGTPRRIVVPESAIQEVEGRTVVFTPSNGKNGFHVVSVEVGVRADGKAEIIKGLNAGDRVVVEGTFVLKSQLLRGQLGEGDND
jgi:cobalt-zinc-cadmium efflux system membrane fusion protein